MVVDFGAEFDLPVIHYARPNDWIDFFVPHRPLKPVTEVVPSANLDADCFSSGMQMLLTVWAVILCS